jgi:hypothetical protein
MGWVGLGEPGSLVLFIPRMGAPPPHASKFCVWEGVIYWGEIDNILGKFGIRSILNVLEFISKFYLCSGILVGVRGRVFVDIPSLLSACY